MGFDPATLLTVTFSALLLFALLLAVTGMEKAARADRIWWIAAFLLGAAGFMLMIAAPAKALAAPRDLANSLFLLAYGCCHAGARRLAGRRPTLPSIFSGALLWLVITWGLHISAALRMPAASALICAYSLGIAWELRRGADPEALIRRIAAWLCLAHAGFFAVRLIMGPSFGLTKQYSESMLSLWGAILAFETILFAAALSAVVIAAFRERDALDDRKLAMTDKLTGIGNRRAFDARAGRLIGQARRTNDNLALMLIDIDGFKAVNDAQGHAAGDRLLTRIAIVTRALLPEPDLFWRIGGDEFAVLLRDSDMDHACAIADAIRGAIGKNLPRVRNPAHPSVSVTIGIAMARAGKPLEQLLEEADAALYAGKRGGRDRVVSAAGQDRQRTFGV